MEFLIKEFLTARTIQINPESSPFNFPQKPSKIPAKFPQKPRKFFTFPESSALISRNIPAKFPQNHRNIPGYLELASFSRGTSHIVTIFDLK